MVVNQGSPDAYYSSLDGFTGPGGHPEQHGGPESRANGSYYCLEQYLLEKFPWTMLPGLRIVKRLEQQNKNNKKLQCSLANWLFLAEASKNTM